ncbi:unnamed protein product [Gadus morhua 'NCC']
MIKATLYPSRSWTRERQFQLRLTGTESALSQNNIPNCQQIHSTPNAKLPKAKVACISRISPSLKLTLPPKNRFLPLQESTNAPVTHAPLSPEMRLDKQCGQGPTMNPSPERLAVHASATRAPLSPRMRPDGWCGQRRNKNQSPWRRAVHASATRALLSPEMCPDGRSGQRWNKNQSPRRRAAHASATATSSQQGPISQKADEPDTLIIGDSTIKDITGKKIKTCYFPDGMVSDINQKLATIILENPKIAQPTQTG